MTELLRLDFLGTVNIGEFNLLYCKFINSVYKHRVKQKREIKTP